MITADQLKAIHISEEWLEPLNLTFAKYEINTPLRMASFIGQCMHESGNFTKLVEGLNYKADALMKLFGRHRISEADCMAFGRRDDIGQKADQEQIANRIYGGSWGKANLGNEEDGDGSLYRGRGLIQLTGRSNYAKCGEAIGEDLIASPDLLSGPRCAALSAGWFWNKRNLNADADARDWKAMTKKINGGDLGLDDRIKHITQVLKVLEA